VDNTAMARERAERFIVFLSRDKQIKFNLYGVPKSRTLSLLMDANELTDVSSETNLA
jgi:hypothetical protein